MPLMIKAIPTIALTLMLSACQFGDSNIKKWHFKTPVGDVIVEGNCNIKLQDSAYFLTCKHEDSFVDLPMGMTQFITYFEEDSKRFYWKPGRISFGLRKLNETEMRFQDL